MKTCRRCLDEKELSCFSKQAATADGLQSYCKSCHSASRAKWRLAQKINEKPKVMIDPCRSVIFTKKGEQILVDPADYDALSAFQWHLNRGGYVVRNVPNPASPGKKVPLRMHRQIMGLIPGDSRQVDHINGVKTDNRRINLRICSGTENIRNRGKQRNNTSGYKGVYLHPRRRNWMAKIRVDTKLIDLGAFDTPEEAYAVYCAAAVKYHGEFANTN